MSDGEIAVRRHPSAVAVLIASGLRKEFSGDPLFDGVSFTLRRGDRLALAGPNGAGKTTLLRTIVGRDVAHAGELAFAKDARVALHDQRPPRGRGLTLREYSLSGAGDLVGIEEELRAPRGGDGRGRPRRRDAPSLQRRAGAARARRWVGLARPRASIAARPRVPDADLDRPLDTFSGGELTRASLARALSADPDLLLLDEPTNHLDVQSLEWLERELISLDAAVILVAHDRWFLEAVTTAVLELGGPKPFFFDGPWHAWRREKAARASAAATQLGRVSDDIERLERFVDAVPVQEVEGEAGAGEADADRSPREAAPGRRAGAGGADEAAAHARIRVPQAGPHRAGSCWRQRNRAVAAGDKLLLDARHSCSSAASTSRSSARTARERRPCSRPCSAQREPDAGRSSSATASSPRTSRSTRRSCRSTARPRRDERRRPACRGRRPRTCSAASSSRAGRRTRSRSSVLSGGERRRLALALVVASGANLLVLDEPTNHLDLESREALEAALEAFPGTVLLVSHDRAVLDAVPDRIVASRTCGLRSYDGGWADLVRPRECGASRPRRAGAKPRSRSRRDRRGSEPSELDEVEKQIAELEQQVAEMEARLAANWTDMDLLAALHVRPRGARGAARAVGGAVREAQASRARTTRSRVARA